MVWSVTMAIGASAYGSWYGNSVLCLTVSRQLSPRQAVSPTATMVTLAPGLVLRCPVSLLISCHIHRPMGRDPGVWCYAKLFIQRQGSVLAGWWLLYAQSIQGGFIEVSCGLQTLSALEPA